jgi:hypothetical protein
MSAPAKTVRSRRQPYPRRTLALLADAGPAGYTEALLLANGLTIETMVELVRAALATATPERVKAGGHKMEVAMLRITEMGRRALGSLGQDG